MSHPQLSIVIPAAGDSKRLGQAKQLVQYKRVTLIQNALNLAHSITPAEVIVVTGAYEKEIKAAVNDNQVRWVHNERWSAGMGSSIARGVAAINPGSSGVMILLVDQWRLQVSDLRLLIKKWHSNKERIVCALAEHQNMPPVIFPASCFGRLQALAGDRGAREILGSHPELVTPVLLENAQFDLDTPLHLQQLENTDL